MTLADTSIRRPVFAWMLMLGLIVFGLISFKRLGISQMPDVDFPVLSVQVTWEGAAPAVVEAEIVDRLEQSLVSVEGLRELSSSIRQGQANISLEFDISRNIDVALQEVQSAISRIRLPLDVDPPVIRKTNPDDQPIMWLGISSTKKTLRELINYIDLNVRDEFQILPGVGEVMMGGYTDRSLRIWVDNEKLNKFDLTVLDVREALQRGHIEAAAGIIENSANEINLRIMGEGTSPDEVSEILITSRGGRPIYESTLKIGDVATVEDGLADIRRISRTNGVPGIGLGIKKQRDANAVEVGDRVKKRMQELAQTFPDDMSIGVNFDSTVFIKESVEETEFTVFLSALVTGFVCWLFLGALSPTFNILLSIPTSIIGTFTVIYFMGFTLNMFTILGLALAIGIVVDDAIMVLENIYRHKDMGKSRIRAALDGSREITFAAVAATIAVIAIFLPVAFMKGIIGRFFFEFGVTISAAVALSLLEAITLTPMRASQMISEGERGGRFANYLNSLFYRCSITYKNSLAFALNFRWTVLVVAIGIFLSSLLLVSGLRKEFIPAQDQSMFITRIETAVGSSLEFTSSKMKLVEDYFRQKSEVTRVFGAVGGFGGGDVNAGIVFVSLVPKHDRSLSQESLMQRARDDLKKVEGVKVFLQDLSTRAFSARRGFPIEFDIRGANWDVLHKASEEIIKKLGEEGQAVDISSDYKLGQPEVQVFPLREQAAKRGVSVEAITETVSTAIGGIRQGKYTQDGRRYDTRIRLAAPERTRPEDIYNLTVRNVYGELVPIRDVVRVETNYTLQTLSRKNRERAISISANVAPGASQSAVLARAEEISKEVLPNGYRFFLGGGAQTFKESFQSLAFVFWLGVGIAYMVLASQFNSFLHPVVVLLSLPFSITGAIVALAITSQSLNLYSIIGIILLMGIVKKNAILLVEFTNHKRFEEGMDLRSAILEAAPVRLRPILMTSLSTLAAAIAPALALGPGAESRIPMSITIIGGVLVSTIFTLFVVPCAYSLMARLEGKRESID